MLFKQQKQNSSNRRKFCQEKKILPTEENCTKKEILLTEENSAKKRKFSS